MPAAGLGDLVPRKVDGRVLFRQPAGARVAGGEELEEVEHASVFDEFDTHKGRPGGDAEHACLDLDDVNQVHSCGGLSPCPQVGLAWS